MKKKQTPDIINKNPYAVQVTEAGVIKLYAITVIGFVFYKTITLYFWIKTELAEEMLIKLKEL